MLAKPRAVLWHCALLLLVYITPGGFGGGTVKQILSRFHLLAHFRISFNKQTRTDRADAGTQRALGGN